MHPDPVYHMNFFQAVVIGLIQGIFELFPLSSLGHTVLIPSWIGGTWATLVRQESSPESPYLAFIVGLHLANAVALLVFYLREWGRLIGGFFRSLARWRIETDTERLAWLIVIATVPVGILGVLLEHKFRVLFAKPEAAAIFLTANGLILFGGELYRRRRVAAAVAAGDSAGAASGAGVQGETGAGLQGETDAGLQGETDARVQGETDAGVQGETDAGVGGQAGTDGGAGAEPAPGRAGARFRDEHIVSIDEEANAQLSRIGVTSSVVIGASQALALLAGISREGVAMVGGLSRGLSNENAMRFAFLLSTPVIFAAGALKVPDLLGPLGDGIRGQVVAGSVAAVAASLLAIALAARYFKTRTLVPFAVYSVLFGVASVIRFAG